MASIYRLKMLIGFAFAFVFGIANATIYPTASYGSKTLNLGSSSIFVSGTLKSCTDGYFPFGLAVGNACLQNTNVRVRLGSFCSTDSSNFSSNNAGVSFYNHGSDTTKGTICAVGYYPSNFTATYPAATNFSCPSNSTLKTVEGYDGSVCSCNSGYGENNGSCSLVPCTNGQVRKADMSCFTPSCATGVTYGAIDPFGKGIKRIVCNSNCIESWWTSADGASKILNSVGGACDFDYVPPCPAGMITTTIAGQTACKGGQPNNSSSLIPTATPGTTTSTTKDTKTNSDGSKTENVVNSTTECTTYGKCTTTNTTTINNYNSAGEKTSSTTGPKTSSETNSNDYCEKNPSAAQCANSGNLDTSVPAVSSSSIDVSAGIGSSPRLLGESCVIPPSFTVLGQSYTMDVSLFCQFLGVVGYLMVAASSVICVRMITS